MVVPREDRFGGWKLWQRRFCFDFVHTCINFVFWVTMHWFYKWNLWNTFSFTRQVAFLSSVMTLSFRYRLSFHTQSLSRVWLFETLWSVAHQAPLSMEFSKQEYWSRLPFRLPGDRPNLRIESASPALRASSLPLSPLGGPVWVRISFVISQGHQSRTLYSPGHPQWAVPWP